MCIRDVLLNWEVSFVFTGRVEFYKVNKFENLLSDVSNIDKIFCYGRN